MTVRRPRCDKCNIKISKKQPKLKCSICNTVKHLSCEKLTKADANYLIYLNVDWTCYECITNILPVNATYAPKRLKTDLTIGPKFKLKCVACNGYCYTPRNIRTCNFCDGQVHAKCWNHDLGCNKCCEDMIPGFQSYTYELIGDPYLKNDKFYNPYRNDDFTQLIGDIFENNNESSKAFDDASEILVSCKYKEPKFATKASKDELSVFSLNVRSLKNKISDLRENIDYYENFDALLFQETNCTIKKLENGIEEILLDGFHEPLVQDPARTSGKGGGLVIYINKRVCAEEDDIVQFVPYSEPDNNSGEFLFVKLQNCKSHRKTVILGNVYRTPSNKPDQFNKLYDKILGKLNSNRYGNKLKYIFGDFNQDLIKYDNDNDCQNLIDNAHNHGFVQIVSRPTRITEHSATLIDHVYTNNIDSTLSCNIITLDISDHLATHTRLSLGTSTTYSHRISALHNDKHNKSELRIFNEANNLAFKELINAETWEVPQELDAQSAYDEFQEIYSRHYNKAYPLKSERVRRKHERQNPKPWILPWLEDACARKNNLYHEFVKEPSPENKAKYDKLNEFCEKHVDIAKAKYYKSYFEKYKDNSRKQWQVINGLLNRKKCGNNKIHKLISESGEIKNSAVEISDCFNKYFSNIASTLKQSIPSGEDNNSNTNFCEFLKNPADNSIQLEEVSAGEVHGIIKNFKNKATRDSKMSALKIANESYKFTSSLANIVSRSFAQGIFPDQLKLAKVIPIHKEGPKTNVSNYRPISLLSSFSKIYEKIMHNRIMKFLNVNNSLFGMQYGFRPGRSCEHALLDAQSTISDSLNKRQISILLLIDFSKAFDMVDHTILLWKLEYYGIRGLAQQWLKSYLSNRKQFVSINGSNSGEECITYGVPQGSILGPLLFIIYINDIPEIACFAKFILYADDANIILTGDNIDDLYKQLINLTTTLLKWVNCNGLALNLKKTKYMIFSRSRVELPHSFVISNMPIERKSEARFLGVIIDESLKWSRHVKTVLSKMSRYIGIMYKIKKLLPLKSRLQVFNSFIQSHVHYCSLVWGFCCKSSIEAIFSKQKKGLRAVIPGFINYKFKD